MIFFLTRVTIWKVNHAPVQKTRSGLSLYPLAIEGAKQPTFCEALLSPQSGSIVPAFEYITKLYLYFQSSVLG